MLNALTSNRIREDNSTAIKYLPVSINGVEPEQKRSTPAIIQTYDIHTLTESCSIKGVNLASKRSGVTGINTVNLN